MSTTVLETGAVFRLEDQFSTPLEKLISGLSDASKKAMGLQTRLDTLSLSPVVTRMQAQWAELNELADRGVSGVVAKFDAIGPGVEKAFRVVPEEAAGSFRKVTDLAGALPGDISAKVSAGMDGAAAKMFSPIVEASRVAAAEASANLAGIAKATEAATARAGTGAAAVEGGLLGNQTRKPGSGGFGRAHGSGLHFGRVGGEVGGIHVATSGNMALAAAGLALDGIYESAQIDDVVAKGLMTSQIPISPGVSQTDAGKRIHDMIQNAAKSTGFGFHDVGEGILEGQRLLQQMPFGQRNDLIEAIIPSAAYEARMKGSSLPEALEAIIGIAHQTQTYDPAGITSVAKNLAYTSLLTPSPLPQFQTALGYSLPELHNGLGMDPGTLMLLTATMQQSGIKGTRSGTWLRSFFEQSEPGNDEHNEALRKLGMLDGSNKPSWRVTGADGKVDWQKSVQGLSGILQHDQQSIPVDERLGLLRKAYGERGAGFASLMMGERFTENLGAATRGLNSFKGGEDLLGQYASASILQQSRLAMEQFNVSMSDLGTKLMPAATKAVQDFSDIMKAFDQGPSGALKLFFDKAIKPDLGPLGNILPVLPHGDPSLTPMTQAEKNWRLQHRDQEPPAGMFHPASLEDAGKKLGLLGDKTGIVLTSFDGLDKRTIGLNDNFGGLGTGSSSLTNTLKILEATALGAARALASVAMSGAAGGVGGGGGGGGIINASYGGGGIGGGLPTSNAALNGAGGASVRGHIDSTLRIGDHSYRFGSGGVHGSAPIPYGDYPITPGAMGSWGVAHGAIGINGNKIWDATLNRYRLGILMHAGAGTSLITEGCMAFLKQQYPQIKAEVMEMVRKHGHAYLHVGPNGASVTSERGEHPTVSRPPSLKTTPGSPAAGISAMNMPPIIVNHKTILDGKVLARNTVKHIAMGGRYPTSMGGPDAHSHYVSPGTPVTDAA